MSDVTRVLEQIELGDPAAAEKLLPLVYEELRKLAAAKLAQEKPGQTLQATALVHEAYLRLVGGGGARSQEPVASQTESDDRNRTPGHRPMAPRFNSRGHFFGAAAEAIRRILVDHAREKKSLKRGGEFRRIDLETIDLAETPSGEQLLIFSDALEALESADGEAGRLVKLRYFAGMSVEDAAEAMGISRSAAYDHWTFARAWLRCRLEEGEGEG